MGKLSTRAMHGGEGTVYSYTMSMERAFCRIAECDNGNSNIVRWYIKGLRPEFQGPVAACRPLGIQEAISSAMMIENFRYSKTQDQSLRNQYNEPYEFVKESQKWDADADSDTDFVDDDDLVSDF